MRAKFTRYSQATTTTVNTTQATLGRSFVGCMHRWKMKYGGKKNIPASAVYVVVFDCTLRLCVPLNAMNYVNESISYEMA